MLMLDYSVQGNLATVEIVDICTGCAKFDLSFLPVAFKELFGNNPDPTHNVSWFVIGGGE